MTEREEVEIAIRQKRDKLENTKAMTIKFTMSRKDFIEKCEDLFSDCLKTV